MDDSISQEYLYQDFKFYYQNAAWKIICNSNSFVDKQKTLILDLGIYKLTYDDVFYEDELYVYPYLEEKHQTYSIGNQLLFKNQSDADVVIEDYGLNSYLLINSGYILSKNIKVYVNGYKYHNQHLQLHDCIEFLNMRVYYLKDYIISSFNKHKLHPYEMVYAKALKWPIIKTKQPYFEKFQYHIVHYQINLPSILNDVYHPYGSGQAQLMTFGICIVALINCYLSMKRGSSLIELIPILILPFMMTFSAIFFPIYQRRKHDKKVKNDQKAYKLSVDEIFSTLEKKIVLDYENNLKYFNFNAIDYDEIHKKHNYYYLNRQHPNFLKICLGKYDFQADFKIKADNISEYAKNIIADLNDKYSKYPNIPYMLDLNSCGVVTFISEKSKLNYYFNNLLMMLCLSHDYQDLKIAVIVDEDYLNNYPLVTMVKHLYYKNQRLIFKNVEDFLRMNFGDCHLILLSFKNLNYLPNNNIKLIYFSNQEIHANSNIVIRLKDNLAFIKEGNRETKIIIDYYKNLNFELLYRLRHIHHQTKSFDYSLMNICNYKYCQNISNKLETKAAIYACFGFDDNQMAIEYDISDQGIGPHLLLVGSSGSGKSNFLIAFLLNLAYRYSTKSLSFAIVDYKGSGISDALSFNNQLLRHVAMNVNDLDDIDFNRSLSAFKLECKRREKLFKDLSKITRNSILSLKDYLCLNPERYNLPYLSNILIVIDEFAELKKKKPEFLSEIISIARIGRSLGIYLLLATQKATAVVDDEILANTNIKIALRLQNEIESNAIINSNLASKIENVGEFYLRFNNKLIHGHSLYAREFVDKQHMQMVCDLNPQLEINDFRYFHSKNEMRESSLIVKEILERNEESSYKIFNDKLKSKDLKELVLKTANNNHIILGEYDDFNHMQIQNLQVDLSQKRLLIIVEHNYHYIDNILKLLVANYQRLNQQLIIVGEDKRAKTYSDFVEYISLSDEDDIRFLFKQIKNMCGLSVVLADYNLMVNNDNRYIYEELFNEIIKNNHLIIIANAANNFSLRLLNNAEVLLSHPNNKDEIMYAYGFTNVVSEENICLRNDNLVGFKYADVKSLTKQNYSRIVRKMPKNIFYYTDNERILLGINLENRLNVYLRKNMKIAVISYYDEEFARFKRLYHNADNFEYYNYNDLTRKQVFKYFIWLGPHIHNQYLFTVDNDLKLHEDEVYLSVNNKGQVVKIVNSGS